MRRLKMLLAFSLFFGAYSAQAQMNPKVKLQDALKLIQDNYVDPVNDERVVDAAIKAMLSNLDPHSSYVSREEAEAINNSMMGSFAGIGISFAMIGDSTFVTSINADGPAFRVGLKVGDQITTVDGKSILGKNLKNQEVMNMLRGEKGKAVKLEIVRKFQSEPLEFTVNREQIAELSITASYMVTKNIGYIALSVFSMSTRREMDAAIEKLQGQGMTKLILDLQANGGGLVEAAVGVADEFLEKDKTVFYSVTNSGVRDYMMAGGFGRFYKGELVLLIDESTASSSEILSGALQDWDRAVVIGRRSFGKGLMQKGLQLADGSAIRLTAARYFTPSDRSIQKPYAKGKTDYFEDFNRRMASGELKEEGHIQFPDSLKHTTLVNKRTVYGGGGIMPDKFVPIDTAVYSTWMNRTMNSGIVSKLAFNMVQQEREKLNQNYPSFETFNQNFRVDDQTLDKIFEQATVRRINIPSKTDQVARKSLAIEMKAEIADMLFTGKGFAIRVRNESSKAFTTALEVLNSPSEYNRLLGVGNTKSTNKKNTKTRK
ncbi:S41 family peptidase [Pedobacter ureilyticus]|uniref:S41 family peptidase n=1 Tax=Pedobacter ureilyticus TaxID=1393051 RepID=A0ABW9J9Q7_9SPHI|nr:S41 family peptidase [Pedobacter helvus]